MSIKHEIWYFIILNVNISKESKQYNVYCENPVFASKKWNLTNAYNFAFGLSVIGKDEVSILSATTISS